MERLFSITSDDPDEVQTVLTPIFGNLKITSLDPTYCFGIRARTSRRLAILAIHASDSTGVVEPSHGYFGLNLPLAGNFSATEAGGKTSFGQDIYLSRPYRADADPGSNIGIAELEDELISGFVTATDTIANSSRRKERLIDARTMARVQEFLDSHLTRAVSRADLADVAGVSIRTLSRSFLKRQGTGPMGFLKARRLYAAYRELLAAEAPSTRVTRVAIRYGFNHFGKFAMEYKKAFGESPSVTLNR